MKDYKEVAERVLQRSEEIIAGNRRKKTAIIKVGTMTVCCCFAVLVCLGVWQSRIFQSDAELNSNCHVPSETINNKNQDTESIEAVGQIGDSVQTKKPGQLTDIEQITNHGQVESSEQAEITTQDNTLVSVGNMPNISSNVYISGGMPDTDSELALPNMITMISSYGETASSASYKTPENGTYQYSIPLNDALKEYGDTVLYRVIVDVFSSEQQLEPSSSAIEKERDRLAELGYTVAYETYNDGTSSHHYFSLHANYEQLSDFAASEAYGYMFFLYDERVQ